MTDYTHPLTSEQYEWITLNSKTLVGDVIRRCRIGYDELAAFREDLEQEALTHLFEQYVRKGHEAAYAYVAARTHLVGYVFTLMRGKGSGHQWALSKAYETFNNLIEEYDETDAPERRGIRLPATFYERRPVEEQLIAREAAPEAAAMWAEFEQEVARIIAVMRDTQWHPQSILRSAKALTESAKGTSNYCIANMIGQEWAATSSLIVHYRNLIRDFLDLSPVMQGLVRAEGELRLLWWHHVTQEAINSGQRFIVISPYGAFVVYTDSRKSKDKRTGEPLPMLRIQAGRRIQGRIVNRSVQLGKMGEVTVDKFASGLQRMAEKLAALETRQELEGVAV